MLQERPGIDHLVIGGRDLAALGAGFEAMGFTLTPTAHHPFGTGNRLAILDGNFIEFLGITAPEKIPAPTAEGFSLGGHLTDFLARREGLAFVVLSSEDAHGDQRRFAEAGIATLPPVDFSRAAGQPGSRAAARPRFRSRSPSPCRRSSPTPLISSASSTRRNISGTPNSRTTPTAPGRSPR